MNKIFSFIPNLYFFPFIFAFNTWKSKKTLEKKILLLCLDLFVYTPLWLACWSLFFFLIVVEFYIFDYIFHIDFNSQATANWIILSFIFFGIVIPAIYILKPVINEIKNLFKIHRFRTIFIVVFPLLLIYIVVTQFIIYPNQIIGNSMNPSLKNGDRILIKRYDRNYQRGDIIVFKSPKNPDIEYISRLIALPGDKIKIQDGKVYLNGNILNEKYVVTSTSLWSEGCIQNNIPYSVPQDNIFVMGDNRPQSSDSREYCAIPLINIIGKYTYRYFESKYEPTKEDKINNLFYKGESLYLNSQDDEATKYFEELLIIEPNHQDSLTYLADIFTRKKQYDEAELYFKKSFQINKNNAFLLAKYGYYLQSKGNENEAEEYFKKALAINDTLYNALFGLGYINLNKGQYLKAEEYFNKILSTGINDASTFSNLGAIYFNLKNYPEAKEFYNKALNLYKEEGLNKEYEELYKFIQENKLN